ncbi:MAG: hypothetical protein KME30_32570 [Iphinoe sp. HA4291-MV1]|nr:hypothetical protein [Iphinoe sp. HA4291-MV1]
MNRFVLFGHFIENQKHYSFNGLALEVPHRRDVFQSLATILNCNPQHLYISGLVPDPENEEQDRSGLKALLENAVNGLELPLPYEIKCDPIHAEISLEEGNFHVYLNEHGDPRSGLELILCESFTGGALFEAWMQDQSQVREALEKAIAAKESPGCVVVEEFGIAKCQGFLTYRNPGSWTFCANYGKSSTISTQTQQQA